MSEEWLEWLEEDPTEYYLSDFSYQVAGDELYPLAPFPRVYDP